jgi:hypothetical protein
LWINWVWLRRQAKNIDRKADRQLGFFDILRRDAVR